jgi:hypothetical protein
MRRGTALALRDWGLRKRLRDLSALACTATRRASRTTPSTSSACACPACTPVTLNPARAHRLALAPTGGRRPTPASLLRTPRPSSCCHNLRDDAGMITRVATYNIHKGVQGIGPVRRLRSTTSAMPSNSSMPTWCCCRRCASCTGARSGTSPAGPSCRRPSSSAPRATAPSTRPMPHAPRRARQCAAVALAGDVARARGHVRPPLRAARPAARGGEGGPARRACHRAAPGAHRRQPAAADRAAWASYIEREVPRTAPVLVGGDLNDWGAQAAARHARHRPAGLRRSQGAPPTRRACRWRSSTTSTGAAQAAGLRDPARPHVGAHVGPPAADRRFHATQLIALLREGTGVAALNVWSCSLVRSPPCSGKPTSTRPPIATTMTRERPSP